MQYYFVFDVESVGLYGEGFAVGWVVIDQAGKVYQEDSLYTLQSKANGRFNDERDEADRNWVKEHVSCNYSDTRGCLASPESVRGGFWSAWQKAQQKYPGILLAADVAWPVEANFLLQGILEDASRAGPYPLLDIASIRFAMGLDPIGVESRRDNEQPVHHALADARQSARVLIEALPPAGLLEDYSWIKVKKYQPPADATPDEKLSLLEKHHHQETDFLIKLCRKLARRLHSKGYGKGVAEYETISTTKSS